MDTNSTGAGARPDPLAYGLTDDTYVQLTNLVQALEGLAILFETCPTFPAQGEVAHLTPTLACLGRYGQSLIDELRHLGGRA